MRSATRLGLGLVAVAAAACGGGAGGGPGGGRSLAPSSISTLASDGVGATEPAAVEGRFALMRFLGGPPEPGQITDTLEVEPSAGRRVHVTRARAAAGPDRSCDAEASEGPAWRGLLGALDDPDLQTALAQPKRMPLLVIDAGYFQCRRGAVTIAVSDIASQDAAEPALTAAVRRLAQAYERLRDEVVALPACRGL